MERRQGAPRPINRLEERRAPGKDHPVMRSHYQPRRREGREKNWGGGPGRAPSEALFVRCLREAQFELGERGKHRNQPKNGGDARGAQDFLVAGGGGDEGGGHQHLRKS